MNGTIICMIADSEEIALVRAAADLGDRFGARVVLVGVAQDVVEPVGTEGLAAVETPAHIQERLSAVVAESELADRVERRVEVGDPVDVAVEVAGEEAAGLIVLGARPGLLRRTLRSAYARDLAAAAPCPVLVMPPEVGARARSGSPLAATRGRS